MNEEIKVQWIQALRSGDYEQGQGALRFGNKFCCLGVLCDISGIGKWTEGKGESEMKYYRLPEDDHDWSAFLPTKIREWANVPNGVDGNGVDYLHQLTGMNDEGVSFKKIADYVESNL